MADYEDKTTSTTTNITTNTNTTTTTTTSTTTIITCTIITTPTWCVQVLSTHKKRLLRPCKRGVSVVKNVYVYRVITLRNDCISSFLW